MKFKTVVVPPVRRGNKILRAWGAWHIRLTKQDGLLVLRDPFIGVHVYAPTMEALLEELRIDLFFLWENFRNVDPKILAPGARRLQKNLLQVFEEIAVSEGRTPA